MKFNVYLQNRNVILPPTLALKATPTPHLWLFATMATSPAHLVPCLEISTDNM